MTVNQQKMQQEDARGDRGEDGDVPSVKPRERAPGDAAAAAEGVKLTRISPGKRLVRPGPAGTFSTGISRRPFGPCSVTVALAANMAGTLSAAGEALHRLPPGEARP